MAVLLLPEAAPLKTIPRAVTQGARQTLADLPASAQAAISAGIGRDQAAYHAALREDGSFGMTNPAQNLHAHFTADTATVRAGDVEWNLLLSAWGYGETLQRVKRVAPSATANRVEYPRGALSEWYVNGPQGLEQGFTIQDPNSQSLDSARDRLPSSNFQPPTSNLQLPTSNFHPHPRARARHGFRRARQRGWARADLVVSQRGNGPALQRLDRVRCDGQGTARVDGNWKLDSDLQPPTSNL
jgi:hypothetical protein